MHAVRHWCCLLGDGPGRVSPRRASCRDVSLLADEPERANSGSSPVNSSEKRRSMAVLRYRAPDRMPIGGYSTVA